jgi:hypothetical protein
MVRSNKQYLDNLARHYAYKRYMKTAHGISVSFLSVITTLQLCSQATFKGSLDEIDWRYQDYGWFR